MSAEVEERAEENEADSDRERADEPASSAIEAFDQTRKPLSPSEETARRDTNGGSPVSRLLAELRSGDSPGQTLLATFVAWSTTVAPAALSRSATRPAALVSVFALVFGLVGPVVRSARPALARHLGITAFLALVTAAWLLGAPALAPARLDPLRAVVGAVAWGAYALSWREHWETAPRKAVVDADAPILQARSTLPRGALPIAGIGIFASLVYLVVAWTVRDGDRALAAQAVALACAVFVSTTAASIAVDRGRRSSRPSRRISPYAARALLMLLLFGVVGAAAFILRT